MLNQMGRHIDSRFGSRVKDPRMTFHINCETERSSIGLQEGLSSYAGNNSHMLNSYASVMIFIKFTCGNIEIWSKTRNSFFCTIIAKSRQICLKKDRI